MITIRCSSKQELVAVMTKVVKKRILLKNAEVDIHHSEDYERFVSIFSDNTFTYGSFMEEGSWPISASEYLSMLAT